MTRKVKKVICKICGAEISASNYSKHLRRHEVHPETFNTSVKIEIPDDLTCVFCGKQLRSPASYLSHIALCKNNPEARESPFIEYNKTHEPWNKGLTKETDARVKAHSDALKRKYETTPGPFSGKHHTQETKDKISKARIKYLLEHPDKIPYLLNHSSNESYPEKYFNELLVNQYKLPLKYHLQQSI